jgi:hypothetical protein
MVQADNCCLGGEKDAWQACLTGINKTGKVSLTDDNDNQQSSWSFLGVIADQYQ